MLLFIKPILFHFLDNDMHPKSDSFETCDFLDFLVYDCVVFNLIFVFLVFIHTHTYMIFLDSRL